MINQSVSWKFNPPGASHGWLMGKDNSVSQKMFVLSGMQDHSVRRASNHANVCSCNLDRSGGKRGRP